jgi:hypothetical protein
VENEYTTKGIAYLLVLDDDENYWDQGVYLTPVAASVAKAELEKRIEGITVKIREIPLNPQLTLTGPNTCLYKIDSDGEASRLDCWDIGDYGYAEFSDATIWQFVTQTSFVGDDLKMMTADEAAATLEAE